jgi:hypothetical protein
MSMKWITYQEYQRWMEESRAYCNVFASRHWLQIYSERLLFLAFGHPAVHQVWVLYQGGKGPFRSVITPPLAPHIGRAVAAGSPGTMPPMNEIISFIKGSGFGMVKLDFEPEKKTDGATGHHVTFRLTLPDAPEELAGGFSQKTRNMVNKGEREGLFWRLTDYPDGAIRRIRAHFRRKQIKSGEQFLAPAGVRLRDHSDFFIAEVVEYGEVSWTGMFLMDGDTCYYITGALSEAVSSNASNTVGLHGAMQEAMRRGARIFDFEGSSIPSVARFFAGFGGERCEGDTVEWASLPWRIIRAIRE